MFLKTNKFPNIGRESLEKQFEFLIVMSSGDVAIKEYGKSEPEQYLHIKDWQKLRKWLNECNQRLVSSDKEDFPEDYIYKNGKW